MLGLSKVFIVVLAFAVIVGFGTHNFYNFLTILIIYAGLRIIYNILS